MSPFTVNLSIPFTKIEPFTDTFPIRKNRLNVAGVPVIYDFNNYIGRISEKISAIEEKKQKMIDKT